ncbi:MAG: NPCBM/NEW2 domain-containing protein [Planctomycetes bacterium]|nr:NPCBM/NEW2 domain-containing protein [Planctomycetota bacterium]
MMYALFLALVPLPSDASFVIVSANDEPITGKLLQLSTDFTATVVSRNGDVTIKDVISLRRVSQAIPPFPTGPQLLTANGDRIVGKIVGGERESFRFAPSAIVAKANPWLVPLSTTTAVWLVDTPADTPADLSRYTWTDGNKNRDVVRFRNGDTTRGVIGLVSDAEQPAFRFRPETGDARDIPATDVAAIVFNPLLAKARKPKGPFSRVVLTNGSRLTLVNVAISGNTIKAETTFGQKVELPLDSLVALDVIQGKAAYLSDIKPSKAEHAGFLGVAWPWTADRTVRGLPLQLTGDGGNSTFDKGLGTHPRTVLTYDLGGKYRRFEALVGLDPESGDRGMAVVRIRIDGKEQTIPGLATLASGKPVAVRLDVSKAKELIIEVDYGPVGGVRADVNWANARLVE